MYIKDIEDACRRVINGEEAALKQLGLDNASYPVAKPQNTSTDSLQASYNGVLNTAVAARELQLSFLQKQCDLTLQYIQAIAAAKKVTLQHEVDGQDVTEVMLALIDAEKDKYRHKRAAPELSSSDNEEGEETAECKEREAESRIEDQTEKDEGKGDGKAIVEDEMETESEEKEVIHRPKKRKAVIQVEDSDSEESEEESGSEEGEEESESEESQEEEEKKRELKIRAAESKGKKPATLSHHLSRKCLVGHCCTYEGPNLKRHLRNVHVRKKHIQDEQVDKYFAMGLGAHRRRGPSIRTKAGKTSKGRWKRWCPQPNCHYLGAYLSEHLQNKHHMKPSSSTYKTALMIAVRYKGLKEEIGDMTVPRSCPAPPKTPRVDDSEEEVIPPTPHKVNKTSGATSSPQVQATETATAQDVSTPAPSTSEAVASTSEAVQSATSSQAVSDKDESDDDDTEYFMAEDYFKEKDPKTNRHKWMCYFYRYLFTPNAGFHKDKNRLQHACQVRRLLEETDPHGNDIVFLAEEEGNRAWVDWVIPNLKKKKPGTLKSYLTSFEIFLEYVAKKGKRSYLPPLDDDVRNQLCDLCSSLKKWRRCITKETSSAKWDRYLDESDQLLTATEVEDILSSKPAVDGRAALMKADQADDVEDLSISQYCEARDFLIVTLTRAVGTMPAALENATLKMFNKAKWDDQKRKKVMLISSHKREEDGPAPIPMSPDTEYLLNIFITKLRPKVTDDTDPTAKIFLKADGAPFQKGTIGRRVGAFVIKSGIRPDKAISATDFRKWIVTEMKRKKRMGIPIDEQLLRRLMCHSDRTANEWYLRESLTEQAAEASVQIEIHTKPSKEDSSAFVSPPSKPKPDHDTSKEKSAQASPAEDILHKKDDSVTSAPSGSSSKHSLTPAQHKQIDKVFADDLQGGIEPRRKRIVALMKSDSVLRPLSNSEVHVKKVVDRVRYLFDNREAVDPFQLPEECPAQRTAQFIAGIPEKPPSTIESGRVEWSNEETAAIQEALMFWRKLPTKQEIRDMFRKSQVLRDIFKENTFERIKNKVKNEYRKMWK